MKIMVLEVIDRPWYKTALPGGFQEIPGNAFGVAIILGAVVLELQRQLHVGSHC
jgi:hypothetical protein